MPQRQICHHIHEALSNDPTATTYCTITSRPILESLLHLPPSGTTSRVPSHEPNCGRRWNGDGGPAARGRISQRVAAGLQDVPQAHLPFAVAREQILLREDLPRRACVAGGGGREGLKLDPLHQRRVNRLGVKAWSHGQMMQRSAEK